MRMCSKNENMNGINVSVSYLFLSPHPFWTHLYAFVCTCEYIHTHTYVLLLVSYYNTRLGTFPFLPLEKNKEFTFSHHSLLNDVKTVGREQKTKIKRKMIPICLPQEGLPLFYSIVQIKGLMYWQRKESVNGLIIKIIRWSPKSTVSETFHIFFSHIINGILSLTEERFRADGLLGEYWN